MKELLTINANLLGTWTDEEKFSTHVEVIVVMSEPAYTVDEVGDVVRRRETSQCRFVASPKALRKLATGLEKLADEAEATEQRTLKGHP